MNKREFAKLKKWTDTLTDEELKKEYYDAALKYGLINEKQYYNLIEMEIRLSTFLQPVRSLEYVEEQCKKIVDQLEAEK